MDSIFEALTSYGVLGLWTASLLWNNHNMKKSFQERYDSLNQNVIDVLKDNKKILQSLHKMIQDRHQEERLKSSMRRAISSDMITGVKNE